MPEMLIAGARRPHGRRAPAINIAPINISLAPLAPISQPHQLHQLLIHLLRLTITPPYGSSRAVLEMIPQQLPTDTPERLLHRRDLHQDVRTVAVLVDHLLETAHLPLDPAQAFLVRVLDRGIDGDRLPVRSAPARGSVIHSQ